MPMTMRWLTVLPAMLSVLLAACASAPQTPGISGYGVVQSIQEKQQASAGSNAVGAIGGALLGGLIGSQIGGGSGQTIATAVGAMGGSMAGSAVAGQAGAEVVWVVNVRFEDGIDRAVTVGQRPDFRPGDRVRVEGGAVFRAAK